VLARGGVATVDGDHVLVEPIGAAAAFRSTSLDRWKACTWRWKRASVRMLDA
jgi:hypothetical protein